MFNPTNVTFQAAELLNVLDAVAKAKSGFRSLKDTWRTRQPRMAASCRRCSGLAEFERELIRARTGEGSRALLQSLG
jgi:hypothetical protein